MEDLKEQAPALTDEELRMTLDAAIRREAGWALRDKNVGSMGVQASDDEALSDAVNKVYDDIVSRFSHDENLVLATRAVEKFGKAYIRKVISAGLKDKSIKLETDIAKAFEFLSEACGTPKKKRSKEKAGYKEAVGDVVMARLDEEARLFWWAFYRERSDLGKLNEFEREFGVEETDHEEWERIAALEEKHIGFKKLVSQLKGKTDTPKNLAAWIGARKYSGKTKQKKGELPKESYKALAALKKKAKKRMKKAA